MATDPATPHPYAPSRLYTNEPTVRMRFPASDDVGEISSPMVVEGIKVATAAINSAARQGGYNPVPFACGAVPDIIEVIAAEYAAGWVMTRPAFSAVSSKVPENGKLWMEWAMDQLALLAQGLLDLGLEVVDVGEEVGVISSGSQRGGARERIKQFPRYSPPAWPVDPLPVSHPQYGTQYNRGQYGGTGPGLR